MAFSAEARAPHEAGCSDCIRSASLPDPRARPAATTMWRTIGG